VKDIKAMVQQPREIALYCAMESDFYIILQVNYSRHDEHCRPLPEGQRREFPIEGYTRVSEPLTVSFIALDTNTLVRNAVEALNEEERKTIDELNRKLAQIRDKKSQLLALTHQTEQS
jgi:hypothetical protein